MIVCPNCNHTNPDGAQSCEACFTPLPSMTTCPQCGAAVQADATFCGTCGYNLNPAAANAEENETTQISAKVASTQISANMNSTPTPTPDEEMSEVGVEPEKNTEPVKNAESATATAISANPPSVPSTDPSSSDPAASTSAGAPAASNAQTQLQQQNAGLLHLRSDQLLELPQHLPVIHVGKPNEKVPPDIDVSGFPDADVVSRIHANIRIEGDGYYIEDVGSANGTYINNMPLTVGNRHRLRPGDRVSLGKNDLVTFLFQVS